MHDVAKSQEPRAYSLKIAVGCQLFSICFLLSGCLAQSKIQGKYMSSQTECRSETAKLFADGQQPMNTEQGQAAIASGFSQCMNKEGWHFTTAKPTVVVQNPPTGSPSTNPSAATSTFYKGVPATAATAPTTGSTFYNGAPAAQNTYPPSGAPSTNPSAAAARIVPAQNATQPPTNPVPAGRVVEANPPTQSPANPAGNVQQGPAPVKTAPAPSSGSAPLNNYQPASPDAALPPDYSAGGGRNF